MVQPAAGLLPTLHLVRHGQSTWNLEHRVQGQQNAPELTDLGRQQALTASAELSPLGAVLLLTSDLTRAVHTAEIIGQAIGLTPVVTPLLREQALGSLEGLSTRQATAALAGVDLTDPDGRFGGGESRSDVVARFRTLLASPPVADLGPTDVIIMITHGDTIRIAAADLLGEDLMRSPWRKIDNGSVTTIPARGSKTISGVAGRVAVDPPGPPRRSHVSGSTLPKDRHDDHTCSAPGVSATVSPLDPSLGEDQSLTVETLGRPIQPPSATARQRAETRCAALAKPTGALGRLEELAVWLAACQDRCPPLPVNNVRAVVFAGDHGVSRHGVSAYPRGVTAAMVRLFLAGGAGVAVLARQHAVHLRVLDLGVDDDLADLPSEVGRFKIRRSSGAIHLEDALTADETRKAIAAGLTVAGEEVAAGADLLIGGDMGIGNTTPAAALIAAGLGLPASEVTGRGTGIDDPALAHKQALIDTALRRAGSRAGDPIELLTALGSADIAAGVGYLLGAAANGVPVLLDGVVSVAAALVADLINPGAVAWFAAGHRSTEPAQSLALDKLGLVPLLDLGMRLGEGSGAVAAVPLVRSAALLLGEMALLSDLAT